MNAQQLQAILDMPFFDFTAMILTATAINYFQSPSKTLVQTITSPIFKLQNQNMYNRKNQSSMYHITKPKIYKKRNYRKYKNKRTY